MNLSVQPLQYLNSTASAWPTLVMEQFQTIFEIVQKEFQKLISYDTLAPSDYTLNFQWINLNPQNRKDDIAENIFGRGTNPYENDAWIVNLTKPLEKFNETELKRWNQIIKTNTYGISKWADLHKNAEINLWYDSALVTQKAQKNTFDMMSAISQTRGVNLRLRDIRKLPNLEGNIRCSLHPSTPVYYRVDILKALITDHLITDPKIKSKFVVFSDFDLEPLPPVELFDKRTMDFLNSYGYVFQGELLLENSFFIFNKEKENLQQIHKSTIIDRIESRLDETRNEKIKGAGFGTEVVFDRYFKFVSQLNPTSDVVPTKKLNGATSQFSTLNKFDQSDHRSELFRFMGDSNIPYISLGRNFPRVLEQNPEFIDWKEEPLPDL